MKYKVYFVLGWETIQNKTYSTGCMQRNCMHFFVGKEQKTMFLFNENSDNKLY